MEKGKKMSPKKRKQTKKKGFWQRHQLTIMLVAALVVFIMVGVSLFGFSSHKGETAWVKIPNGATTEAVRDSLRSRLGTAQGMRVYLIWRVAQGKPSVASGSYKVADGEPAWRTAWNIRGGRQTPIMLTWTGARTFDQLAEKISSQMNFTKKEFKAVADSMLRAEGFKKETFPAAFIPDSYEFYATAKPEAVVKRLVSYRNKFWTAKRLSKADALGLDAVGVATIASIVEEESAKTDEWPTIARLYINRLNSGMPLQADPTVKFAVGDFKLRRIGGKHLKVNSPYNTYLNKGLPPGPIRVASKAAIEAVLSAPKHNYIYMCARVDFSGYHRFTASYDEHCSNAKRYQEELNRRGVKL